MQYEEIAPYLTPDHLARLTQAQRIIINLHFGLHGPKQTLQEIALYLGLSRERVRRIEYEAIRRLRGEDR